MSPRVLYFFAASLLGAGIGALLFGSIGALACMMICGAIMHVIGKGSSNSLQNSPANVVSVAKHGAPLPPEELTHKVKSFNSNTYYEIALKQQTCTCLDWLKNRGLLPLNDPRRLCKHLICYLGEHRSTKHNFTLFQEKLDWCFENGRGFPSHCEIFRSEDDGFEIVGFIPEPEQWEFNDNGFWIEIYYKNIRFGFNPVVKKWTNNSKILTDAVNMEKAILNDILPTFPLWGQNKKLINKTERPASRLQSIYSPERREFLRSLDDCGRWVAILSDEFINAHKFELFGTKAAILWTDNNEEIAIVCMSRFTREAPDTGSKYDHYRFNIHDWYWSGFQPKGCATRIKAELSRLFKGQPS